MKTNRKEKTTGIFAAVCVAFNQGFEGLVFVLLALFFTSGIFQSPSFTIATLMIKEMLTLILTIIMVRPRRSLELFKLIFKSKKHKLYFLAGVIGTTMGNLFYLLAFQLAGAAYGGILTSLYPVFSFLLIRFINKEKESGRVWVGVAFAVTGALLFTIMPAIISGSDNGSFSLLQILGIAFGLGAAFFWALEGLLIHSAAKIKHEGEKTQDAALVRSLGTTLTSSFILFPALAIGSTFTSIANPGVILGDLLSSWESMVILMAISVNLVILRYMQVMAIRKIGAKATAIIDTNNFLVPPLFSIFLSYIAITALGSTDPIYETVVWWAWILIIPILVGVFIVLANHKEPGEHDTSLDHVGD